MYKAKLALYTNMVKFLTKHKKFPSKFSYTLNITLNSIQRCSLFAMDAGSCRKASAPVCVELSSM